MKKICNICGRHYKRSYCEFCNRAKRINWDWFAHNYLTPRMKRDLETIKFSNENIQRDLHRLLNRGSLLFQGKQGCGKSVYAAKLTWEVYKIKNIELREFPSNFEFIAVPVLLQKIRKTFDNPEESDADIIQHYSTVDWLVLDDLGLENPSGWVLEVLYTIISYRYEYLLPTIFTTNVTSTEFANRLKDHRIVSRIEGMSRVVKFKDKDLRTLKNS